MVVIVNEINLINRDDLVIMINNYNYMYLFMFIMLLLPINHVD